jgi:hypothetical protein
MKSFKVFYYPFKHSVLMEISSLSMLLSESDVCQINGNLCRTWQQAAEADKKLSEDNTHEVYIWSKDHNKFVMRVRSFSGRFVCIDSRWRDKPTDICDRSSDKTLQ